MVLPLQQPVTPWPPPLPPPNQPPRLPEPVVEPNDDIHINSHIDHYTYTDWAREQCAEHLFSASLRLVLLGSPSPPPDGLLGYILSIRRPLLSGVLAYATKSQLHTTDDDRRHHSSHPPTAQDFIGPNPYGPAPAFPASPSPSSTRPTSVDIEASTGTI